MDFSVYIPARHASTRLPGKPLLPLAGKPLLQHVYERALESGAARVVVATDDERIAEVARGFGAEVCMTAAHHASGTERLAEAVACYDEPDNALVVNLQGDEPEMPGALVRQVAEALAARPDADMATLAVPLACPNDLFDPNVVKVVTDGGGHALYFSRAPIPWDRDGFASGTPPARLAAGPWRRHVGLYAYRAGFLRRFCAWAPSPLERLESLEQLRALHHGARCLVADALAEPGVGVDTPADLARAEAALRRR